MSSQAAPQRTRAESHPRHHHREGVQDAARLAQRTAQHGNSEPADRHRKGRFERRQTWADFNERQDAIKAARTPEQQAECERKWAASSRLREKTMAEAKQWKAQRDGERKAKGPPAIPQRTTSVPMSRRAEKLPTVGAGLFPAYQKQPEWKPYAERYLSDETRPRKKKRSTTKEAKRNSFWSCLFGR